MAQTVASANTMRNCAVLSQHVLLDVVGTAAVPYIDTLIARDFTFFCLKDQFA